MTSASRSSRDITPYITDRIGARFHRSAAGTLWRWRTELTVLTAVTAAFWRLSLLVTLAWAAIIVAVSAVVILAVPHTRRYTTRRIWCVLSRHRLQRVCFETRLHTRSGRLPLILWIRPTEVGERAHLLCRAGVCADDFADHIGEIAAACWARDARVTRSPRFAHLITIDIHRRDLLAPKRIIPANIAAEHEQTARRTPVSA
jgi:hypothetical protein